MVRALRDKGFEPIIIDDLSSGHKDAVSGFEFHQINLVKDKDKLEEIFSKNKISGVIHMASFIQMGESFKNPLKYFENNLISAINLLEVMLKHKVLNIVFSSSAGVYGDPESLPITEDEPKNPVNPYGETKYEIEKMLIWGQKAYGLKFTAIRYFNAAGAALDGSIGEDHPEESHLIPNLIKTAIAGKEVSIFGNDYETKDGTCERDYVHVLDLAAAHSLAISALIKGAESNFYNAGVGRGYSVKEVIGIIEEVTGLPLRVKYGPRRPGDAAALYASTEKIQKELGWKPKYGLKEIIESAYKWHKGHPKGYAQ
jgi:UDP-glucose 4-epimerase